LKIRSNLEKIAFSQIPLFRGERVNLFGKILSFQFWFDISFLKKMQTFIKRTIL